MNIRNSLFVRFMISHKNFSLNHLINENFAKIEQKQDKFDGEMLGLRSHCQPGYVSHCYKLFICVQRPFSGDVNFI